MESKIKNCPTICIGTNIRRIRKSKNIGQTELIRMLDLEGLSLTREALVKIEGGRQHVTASQLKAIKECLDTSYEEFFMITSAD